MTFALFGQVEAGSSTGTVTLTRTTTAGHSLVVCVSIASGTAGLTSVTDTSGGANVWVRAVTVSNATNVRTMEIWYCPSAVSVTSVTLNVGSAIAVRSVLSEWSGGAIAVDQTNTNVATSTTTTPAAAQVTPTTSTGFVVGASCCGIQTSIAVGGSYTLLSTTVTGSASALGAAYLLAPSSGVATGPAFTWTSNAKSQNTVTVVFKAGPSFATSESVPVGDSLTRVAAVLSGGLADSPSISVLSSRTGAAGRATGDNVTVADASPGTQGSFARWRTQTIPIADALADTEALAQATSDSVTLAASAGRGASGAAQATSDSVTLAESVGRALADGRSLPTVTVPMAESHARLLATGRATSDSVTLAASAGRGASAVSRTADVLAMTGATPGVPAFSGLAQGGDNQACVVYPYADHVPYTQGGLPTVAVCVDVSGLWVSRDGGATFSPVAGWMTSSNNFNGAGFTTSSPWPGEAWYLIGQVVSTTDLWNTVQVAAVGSGFHLGVGTLDPRQNGNALLVWCADAIASPSQGSRSLALAGNNGIWKSANSGASWTKTGYLVGETVRSLAVNGTDLYAAVDNSAQSGNQGLWYIPAFFTGSPGAATLIKAFGDPLGLFGFLDPASGHWTLDIAAGGNTGEVGSTTALYPGLWSYRPDLDTFHNGSAGLTNLSPAWLDTTNYRYNSVTSFDTGGGTRGILAGAYIAGSSSLAHKSSSGNKFDHLLRSLDGGSTWANITSGFSWGSYWGGTTAGLGGSYLPGSGVYDCMNSLCVDPHTKTAWIADRQVSWQVPAVNGAGTPTATVIGGSTSGIGALTIWEIAAIGQSSSPTSAALTVDYAVALGAAGDRTIVNVGSPLPACNGFGYNLSSDTMYIGSGASDAFKGTPGVVTTNPDVTAYLHPLSNPSGTGTGLNFGGTYPNLRTVGTLVPMDDGGLIAHGIAWSPNSPGGPSGTPPQGGLFYRNSDTGLWSQVIAADDFGMVTTPSAQSIRWLTRVVPLVNSVGTQTGIVWCYDLANGLYQSADYGRTWRPVLTFRNYATGGVGLADPATYLAINALAQVAPGTPDLLLTLRTGAGTAGYVTVRLGHCDDTAAALHVAGTTVTVIGGTTFTATTISKPAGLYAPAVIVPDPLTSRVVMVQGSTGGLTSPSWQELDLVANTWLDITPAAAANTPYPASGALFGRVLMLGLIGQGVLLVPLPASDLLSVAIGFIRKCGDAVTPTDAVAAIRHLIQGVGASLPLTATAIEQISLSIAQAVNLVIAGPAITTSESAFRVLAPAGLPVAEAISRGAVAAARGHADSVTVTETIHRLAAALRSDSDSLAVIVAFLSGIGVTGIIGPADLTVQDPMMTVGSSHGWQASDGVEIAAAVARLVAAARTDSEGLPVSDSTARSVATARGASDDITAVDSVSRTGGLARAGGEQISLADLLASLGTFERDLTGGIPVDGAMASAGLHERDMADVLMLVEQVYRSALGSSTYLAESLTLAEVITVLAFLFAVYEAGAPSLVYQVGRPTL